MSNLVVTNDSGTLTIVPAPLTVHAADATRIYGASNPPFTGSLTGVVNEDLIVASYGTTATQASDVGTYPITPSVTGPLSNYTVTTINGTLNVTKASQTFQWVAPAPIVYDTPLSEGHDETSGEADEAVCTPKGLSRTRTYPNCALTRWNTATSIESPEKTQKVQDVQGPT